MGAAKVGEAGGERGTWSAETAPQVISIGSRLLAGEGVVGWAEERRSMLEIS